MLVACAQPQKINDKRLQGIDSEIERMLNDHHAAGLAVAIVEKGKTIYSKGFGYRDYENKLPVDEHTIFGIGSCTKSFTASILGILEEEGQLSLSDRPSKYLPALKFATENLNDSIRLKNLLTHTTGLNSWPSESTAILFITPDKYELIPRLQYINPISGVGQSWIYNNLMYSLAGMVVEKASGKSLEDHWKQKLFEPLGMSNTYVDFPSASTNDNISYGYAVDSIYPQRVLPEDMSTRGAGGAIHSTVSDMAKWMNLWLNKGKWEGKQVLPRAYVYTAQDSLILMPQNPNDSLATSRYYGYGWWNWDHKGRKRSEHSGGMSGYVSNVVLYPEEELGIVVLCNQTTSSLSSMVNNIIVERLMPELKEDELEMRCGQILNIAPVNTPSVQDSDNQPTYSLSALVGEYEHPGFGTISISLKDQTLYADFPLTTFRLEYIGDDTFVDHHTEQIPYLYWNFMRLQFEKAENGADLIDKVLINLDQEPVVFHKKS